MGKKGGWISTVKKVLTFESKDTKEKKLETSKSQWFNKNGATEKSENEHNMHAYSVAIATAEAAEAAAAAARAAAAEVARLTASTRQAGVSKVESAAVKIQSAFRAHLARRALRALKGLARLQSLIQSQSVQRQSVITLQCMQTLSRLRSQIRSRRVKMSHENLSLLQQQLQQKFETEPDSLKPTHITTNVGEDWNASAASKEQIEAKLQDKEEAAKKRERALAYANSHRVRKSPLKPDNPTYLDQTYPFWGWSWLERWMATRPWENKTEQNIIPARAHPPKPKTSLTTLSPKAQSAGPKTRPTGPKGSSFKPNENRRHTIAGSPRRGDDNNKIGKSVIFSNNVGQTGTAKKAKQGKGSFGSAKKQISYPSGSPGARRHSGPPKVDATS